MNRRDSRLQPRRWSGLKLLFLSPWRPSCTAFGQGRALYFLGQRLRERGAAAHLVYYPSEGRRFHARDLDALRRVAADWDGFYVTPASAAVARTPDPQPNAIDRLWDPSIAGTLDWLFRATNFDAFIVCSPWLAKAFERAPEDVVKILDARSGFEPLSREWSLERGSPDEFAATDDDRRSILRCADIVWANVSDETQLRELGASVVRALPNAEPLRFARQRPRRELLRFGLFVRDVDDDIVSASQFLDLAAGYIRWKLLPCEILVAGPGSPRLDVTDYPFATELSEEGAPELFAECDVMLALTADSFTSPGALHEGLHRGKAVVALAHAWNEYQPSHRFHRLSSLGDVMKACETIVSAPKVIHDLEAASVEVVNSALRVGDQYLDETAPTPPRRRFPPSLVFVLATSDIWNGSLPLDHVCEVAQYLAHHCDMAFYLHGEGRAIQESALGRLRAAGRVFLSERAFMSLEAAQSRLLQDCDIGAASFAELMDARQLAFWFTSVVDELPSAFDLNPATAIASLSVLALSHPDREIVNFVQQLQRRFSDVVAIDREASLLLASVEGGGVKTHVVPTLWEGYSSEALNALKQATKTEGIVFFSNCVDGPLVDLALRIAQSVTAEKVEVIFDDRRSPDGTIDPGRRTSTSMAFIPLSKYAARLWRRRTPPVIAVEIGYCSAFGAILELFGRANIRRLSLFCPSVAQPIVAVRRPNSAAGVMESALLLRKTLLEAPAVSEEKRSERDSDDGWNLVWDLVGRQKGAVEAGEEYGEAAAASRQILLSSEITLQLEGRGAFRYRVEGWTGSPEGGGSIEAFGIRPLEKIKSEHIEYKAIGPGGRETPWVSDAKLCGTRGKGFPLCGFAVRLAPHLMNRYGVVYEGSFRKSGVAGPMADGEICKPSLVDDALIAINLRIFDRVVN